MDLPTISFFSFLGSIFLLYRFSRYSRFLSRSWKMDPEEAKRYEARARSALVGAGVLMAVCALSLVLAAILYFLTPGR